MKHMHMTAGLDNGAVEYSVPHLHGQFDDPIGKPFFYLDTDGRVKEIGCYNLREASKLLNEWTQISSCDFHYRMVPQPVSPPVDAAQVIKKDGVCHFRNIRMGASFVYDDDDHVKIPEMVLEMGGHSFIVNALRLIKTDDEWECPKKEAEYFLEDSLCWVDKA